MNVYLNHKIFHYLQTTVGREVNNLGKASVRSLDFVRLLGGGVLHTKMWIVDDKHIYVGSANMDWKSLTEVLLFAFFAMTFFWLSLFNAIK